MTMTTQTASALAQPAGVLADLGVVRAARSMVGKLREAYAAHRRERDIETIVDTLHRLNDRQLAALGLTRETIYGFAAARVDALHDRAFPPLDEVETLALPRQGA